ncbi:MAG: esterase family protein, partial [Christensenellaceae bacterium]|nr:esterase family protein [Christensenellaceae bacterium]
MIHINFNYFSDILQRKTSATVMLPDAPNINKALPVMYLLHGYCGDNTDWLYSGNIEQFATEYNIAVVMPAGNNSFYADMRHGANYLKHIGEELPQIISKVFPVSINREDTFIAGLSMGGYGA